ncbi:MAG TPA: sigma factor [Pseudonocardiaceae bacterium]|nr:sigma factor [Pseudonocardiaceae bacterium]
MLDRSAALLRTAFMLIGDRAEAEDLLQTALLRTALKWRGVQGKPDAYARQVLVNLARDRWRRLKRRPAEQSMDDLPPALTLHQDHAGHRCRQTVVGREPCHAVPAAARGLTKAN